MRLLLVCVVLCVGYRHAKKFGAMLHTATSDYARATHRLSLEKGTDERAPAQLRKPRRPPMNLAFLMSAAFMLRDTPKSSQKSPMILPGACAGGGV